MKKLLFSILLLVVGASFGAIIMWVNSYYPPAPYSQDAAAFANILKHSNVSISDDNYSCEGKPVTTVGAVFGSIIEFNNLYKRNMLSYGCINNTCALSVSSCMPWQSQECGSRILKFEIDENNVIQTNTFACIDMP